MTTLYTKSLREEAIRNTHRLMLQKHPEHKKLIDIILKVKLEALEKS